VFANCLLIQNILQYICSLLKKKYISKSTYLTMQKYKSVNKVGKKYVKLGANILVNIKQFLPKLAKLITKIICILVVIL